MTALRNKTALAALGALAVAAAGWLIGAPALRTGGRPEAESEVGASNHGAPLHAMARGGRAPVTLADGALVLEARWGGAPGELGRRGGDESSPEGPMSFVVDAAGRAFVLDQVNARIQIFEHGRAVRSVTLPSDTFQDVALRGDGLVAIDRHGRESIAFVDERDQVTHEVSLREAGVREPGDVTALAQDDDGTWVEVNHQGWVRVADASGAPGGGLQRKGRAAPDGGVLRLARAGGARASLVRLYEGAAPFVSWLEFDMPIWALNALETDAEGRVFVGAEVARDLEGPAPVRAEQVIVLDPIGGELARLTLPTSAGPEETFRTLRVGADGALYQLVFDANGASMRRYVL